MAQTYTCDVCGEVAADFMVTVIQDGSVQAVGVECLLDWALPIAEAFAAAQARETAAADPAAPDPDPATAVDRPEVAEAAHGPQEVTEPAPGDWEADYPQPARSGAGRGRKSGPDVERPDTETEAASDDDR